MDLFETTLAIFDAGPFIPEGGLNEARPSSHLVEVLARLDRNPLKNAVKACDVLLWRKCGAAGRTAHGEIY